MRVVVDYPTFVANNISAQVFYTWASEKFIATYIKNNVMFQIILNSQPESWTKDFVTPIAAIAIAES